MARDVLEDDGGLDGADLGPGGEGVHGKIAQMASVSDSHPHRKVVSASEVGDAHHLGKAEGMGTKGLYARAVVGLQMNEDHGLKAHSHGVGINLGSGAFQDAELSQPAHPGMAGRRCEPHGCRQLLVGEQGVPLQGVEDGEVDSVEGRICAHVPKTIR